MENLRPLSKYQMKVFIFEATKGILTKKDIYNLGGWEAKKGSKYYLKIIHPAQAAEFTEWVKSLKFSKPVKVTICTEAQLALANVDILAEQHNIKFTKKQLDEAFIIEPNK